ncbi:hypothetical protein [Nannocystis exedens]|uniref:hypothetical protein n=1 Tax=Nannocystis exedens TaxID=54 RepID=UPI001160D247|nr:hypothetical protein [Nannocystis exedens]
MPVIPRCYESRDLGDTPDACAEYQGRWATTRSWPPRRPARPPDPGAPFAAATMAFFRSF